MTRLFDCYFSEILQQASILRHVKNTSKTLLDQRCKEQGLWVYRPRSNGEHSTHTHGSGKLNGRYANAGKTCRACQCAKT